MDAINRETEAVPGEARDAPGPGRSKLRVPARLLERGDSPSVLERRDSPGVLEILSKRDPLDAARSLVEDVDETYFVLGGVLAHIKEGNLHERAGHHGRTGFGDFCREELGYTLRKAQYLIDIYETVCRLELDEDRLHKMGWGKAKELVKIARAPGGEQKLAEDFDQLVEFAADHKHDELVEHVRHVYLDPAGGSDSETRRITTFRFTLSDEAAELAERALELQRTTAPTEDRNSAFEGILSEWMMMTEGVEAPVKLLPKTEDQLVAYARERLGLEIQVIGRTGQAPRGGPGPGSDARSEPRPARVRTRARTLSKDAADGATESIGRSTSAGGEQGGQNPDGDTAPGRYPDVDKMTKNQMIEFKAQHGIEIEGWSKMTIPEQREALRGHPPGIEG